MRSVSNLGGVREMVEVRPAEASPLDIMHVLGHQDVTTTMIYAHLNPASRAKAIGLLEKPDTAEGEEAAR